MVTKKKVSKVKAKTKIKKKASAKKVNVTVNVNVTQSIPQKPKIRKNYLMMVLDESGSMQSIKKQAIDAFNEQVQTVIKERKGIEVLASLVKFSSEVKPVFQFVNIDAVEQLNENSYKPDSNTAMYDGVGKAIEMLKAQPDINDEDVTVLVLIISDGAENASKFYNAERVAELIKANQNTGRWTFTYSGANQDLAQVAAKLHIPYGNMTSFHASAAGMSANNSMRSAGLKSTFASYSTGQASVNSFYQQPLTKTTVEKTVTTTTTVPKDKS